jgi:hypothetical protein
MEDARGYAEAEDMDWLYEAVIRYLQVRSSPASA